MLQKEKYWQAIRYTLNLLYKDHVSDLVVTMTSAIPYAFVLRELAKLTYGEGYLPQFYFYDPCLHPESDRHHTYLENEQELYQKQKIRLQHHFAKKGACKIGVFDEAGQGITGKSIRIAQQEMYSITGKKPKRYTCGKQGLLVPQNATSELGKVIIREEDFCSRLQGRGSRIFKPPHLNQHISRTSRKQFRLLQPDQEIHYLRFRGVWRATGICGINMIRGYRDIARQIALHCI